ncbi:DinB family protein [Amycolatopsis sp. lyj-112]|uniref:DinB family protein n=1 Tax=Amycolatopsis sp. lyj-112 TaxID=2789288 RepID=UPI00397DB87D
MSIALFTTENKDRRTEPPGQADERATLSAFLRWQRDTMALKCEGLDPEALSRRSVPPSSLSLLGMIRHLAEVEHMWFRQVLAGQDVPPLYYSDTDPDGDFDGAVADAEVVAEAWKTWRDEVAFAESFVAAAPDLEVSGNEARRGPISLRWVLVHMIEEYARHNGHIDLLREQIDGAVGQ